MEKEMKKEKKRGDKSTRRDGTQWQYCSATIKHILKSIKCLSSVGACHIDVARLNIELRR